LLVRRAAGRVGTNELAVAVQQTRCGQDRDRRSGCCRLRRRCPAQRDELRQHLVNGHRRRMLIEQEPHHGAQAFEKSLRPASSVDPRRFGADHASIRPPTPERGAQALKPALVQERKKPRVPGLSCVWRDRDSNPGHHDFQLRESGSRSEQFAGLSSSLGQPVRVVPRRYARHWATGGAAVAQTVPLGRTRPNRSHSAPQAQAAQDPQSMTPDADVHFSTRIRFYWQATGIRD
jgi:hypothetical protein